MEQEQPPRVVVDPNDVTLSDEGSWANIYTRERKRRGEVSERVQRRRLTIDEVCEREMMGESRGDD
jgi:hypothetical protein